MFLSRLFILVFISFLLSSSLSVSAQTLKATSDHSLRNQILDKEFEKYNVLNMDWSLVKDQIIKDDFTSLKLNIDDDLSWEIELYPSDLISDNSILTLLGETGKVRSKLNHITSLKGNLKGEPESNVILTALDNKVYLSVETQGEIHMIEPLKLYSKSAKTNDYLHYSIKNISKSNGYNCGQGFYGHLLSQGQQLVDESLKSNEKSAVCQKLELSIAVDYSLVQKEGSVENAMTLVTAVMGLVATDYDDSFANEIQIEIVEILVSNCSDCDPWTSSKDPLLVLSDFTVWGEGGGFSRNYDLATFWTARTYQDGLAGLAYKGTVCTDDKYVVLSKYTNNGHSLRVMTSHEMGHAFDCGHNYTPGDACDGNITRAPLMMDPSVNPATTSWADGSQSCSQNSTALVDAYVASVNCMNSCNASACDDVSNLRVNSFGDGYVSIDWDGNADSYRVKIRKEGSFDTVLETTTTISSYNWYGSIDLCQDYVISVNPICGTYEGLHKSIKQKGQHDTQLKLLSINTRDCNSVEGTYSLEIEIEHNGGNSGGIDIDLNGTNYNVSFSSSPQTILLENLPTDNVDNASVYIAAASGGGTYCDINTSIDIPATSCDMSQQYTFNDCQLPTGWSITSSNNINFSDPYEWKFASSNRLINNYATGPNASTSQTIDGSCMAYFDDDITAESIYTGTIYMCTNSVDLSEYTDVFISYDYVFHNFEDGKGTSNASMFMVEAYDGAQWRMLSMDNSGGCPWYDVWNSGCIQSMTFDVTDYVNDEFKVRFLYTDGESGDWTGMVALDNYKIKAKRALGVLPLNLLSINSEHDNREVKLKWRTANEIDVDYYEIEKSSDGHNFVSIGKLDANNQDNQAYEFLDAKANYGHNYYRLKMWDLDGVYEYSKIISEFIARNVKEDLFSIYPNPVVNNQLTIRSSIDLALDEVIIYDVNGKVISETLINSLEAEISIDLSTLVNGLYFIEMKSDGTSSKQKFFKL